MYSIWSPTITKSYLFRSTVVTLNTTPLSQRIMKSLWEKGQFPMLSPSLPAWETEMNIKKKSQSDDIQNCRPFSEFLIKGTRRQGKLHCGRKKLRSFIGSFFHSSIYLAVPRGLQDLSSLWPGIELGASAVKAHNSDHWTTREFLPLSLKNG